MANRKLSIGCVLLMGGALTNCGGQVGTPSERSDERGGQGGSGFVGVPITGGYQGTIAGATGIGFGGYVGACCPGTEPGAGAGGYVGVPPLGGHGGYVGTPGGGEGPYGGEGGYVGVPPEGGAAGWRNGDSSAGQAGNGGNCGDDGI